MTYQLDGVEHLALLGELLHVHLRHKTHPQSTSAQTATLNLTIFPALYACMFSIYRQYIGHKAKSCREVGNVIDLPMKGLLSPAEMLCWIDFSDVKVKRASQMIVKYLISIR